MPISGSETDVYCVAAKITFHAGLKGWRLEKEVLSMLLELAMIGESHFDYVISSLNPYWQILEN